MTEHELRKLLSEGELLEERLLAALADSLEVELGQSELSFLQTIRQQTMREPGSAAMVEALIEEITGGDLGPRIDDTEAPTPIPLRNGHARPSISVGSTLRIAAATQPDKETNGPIEDQDRPRSASVFERAFDSLFTEFGEVEFYQDGEKLYIAIVPKGSFTILKAGGTDHPLRPIDSDGVYYEVPGWNAIDARKFTRLWRVDPKTCELILV